jgi:hypothetical protein
VVDVLTVDDGLSGSLIARIISPQHTSRETLLRYYVSGLIKCVRHLIKCDDDQIAIKSDLAEEIACLA